MLFDLHADTIRRRKAHRDYTIYEGEWDRPVGWYGNAGYTAPICGPFGEIVRQAIETTFEGGQGRPLLDERGQHTGKYGYASRWWALLATCNPAINVTQMLAGKESSGRAALLYHEPLVVSGIPGSAWEVLRRSSNLDVALLRKQSLSIACGSAGVGVTIAANGRIPGLRAFAPHEVTFIASPNDPLVAEVAIQWSGKDEVIISDIRDTLNPRYGRWRSIAEWVNGYEPMASADGAYYPFRWLGRPLLHIVACRSRQDAPCLQPGASALSQLTIDTILSLAWCNHVIRYGSINRVAVTSSGGGRVEGLDQLSMDLRSVIHLSGGESPAIEVIPHGMEGAKILADLCRDALQSHLAMIDGDVSVRAETKDAKSGVAISLERAGVKAFAQKQARTQTPFDTEIIQLLIAAYNWQARSGYITAQRMGLAVLDVAPEEIPVLDYPIQLSESEKAQLEKSKQDAAQGLIRVGDRLGAWMVMSDLDPKNPEARAKAFDLAATIAEQNAALVRLGFNLQPETIAAQQPPAPVDETVMYIPPADVADTAATGLRLQREFRDRWETFKDAALLKRAKALQDQTPMRVGEIRALAVWLNANAQAPADGSAGDGTWGDMADPSGEFIRYLSQGGDPAQVWCATILSNPPGNDTFQPPSQ
jgi:hypothetical protein